MTTRTRLRRTAAAAIALLALTACGSQLDPNTVVTASGGGDGGGSAGVNSGTDLGAGTTTGDVPMGDVPAAGADAGAVPDAGAGAPAAGGDPAAGAPAAGAKGGDKSKGKGAPAGNVKAGSCDGFKNQTGITDSTITLANASDISGPVPGIFESAQQATRAFAEYFNSQSTICGRKLSVMNLDSRADAGANQQAYTKACAEAFAAVGSMSAFDSGGSDTAQACGLPDLRSVITSPERQACKTCVAAYTVKTSVIPDAAPKWFAQKFPDAVQNAAVLYINAGAAVVNAKSMAAGYEKGGGWKVSYLQGIDVAEFNFAPYVQQMKAKGVRAVAYQGPYQNSVKLQQAMQQQGFKPDFFLQDPTIYDKRYIQQAGAAAEGSYIYASNDLFENTANAEVQLYLKWLQQVKPGAIPNYYGLYAWSAARLFAEKATALGGKLTRESMVAAVKSTTAWTGNGAHAAMNLATGMTSPCQKVVQYSGGKWQQVSPGDYMCGGLISSGVG